MLYFYAVLVMLDFIAIILVINEDIFYEAEEKFFKIFWILLLPILGAVFAMIKLNRLHNYKRPKFELNTSDNIREYEFVDSLGGFDGTE